LRGTAGVVSGASEAADVASGAVESALGIKGAASDSAFVGGGGSVGFGAVAFGCHFLRSGAGALVSWADTGGVAIVGWGWAAAGSLGRLSGGISGTADGTDLCSDEGVADLGCHFLRSGAADVDEVSMEAG